MDITDSSPANDFIRPVSLADILGTLYRRKLTVIAITFVCLMAGLLIYTLSPRVYSAWAIVLLENQQKNIPMRSVLSSDTNDTMLIPSEIQVLISRNLMGKVVDKLALLPKNQSENARDALIDQMLENLKVHQIEKSRAIEVRYNASNPQTAADIVNALTQIYISQQLRSDSDTIHMTGAWLADKVLATQKRVSDIDNKIAQYRADNGIINVDGRGIDMIEQNISDLSNKLVAANAVVAESAARLSAVSDSKKLDSAPEVLASPLIQRLREREAVSRDDLASLQDQLGPQHPKVLAAQAQVTEIDRKIQQEIAKLAEGLRREHQTALDNAINIQKQLDILRTAYNKYKASNVGLSALQAESATYHSFLENLNLRLKETQSQEDVKFQTPYAEIISPATVPARHASPKGKLIMMAALLLGLGFGVAIALSLDYLQSGIYNGRQLQQMTGRHNIAVLPKASLNPAKNLKTYADFPILEPSAPYMQCIRALSIFLRMEMGRNPDAKIFNFTSAGKGEGKSAIVASVARQLALEGVRVLAVDCDVRDSTLTKSFGLEGKSGLNEILKGQLALSNAVTRDSKTSLSLMGVGMPNDVNVMSRSLEEWDKLGKIFAAPYDIVLLDSPSILAFPESRLIAKISQNILVVQWKKTPSKLLGFAIDTLHRLECRIVGTVITMSENKKGFSKEKDFSL